MGKGDDMIVIQGPIITDNLLEELARPSSRVIYSIQMANGMVYTSPESFEATSGEPATPVAPESLCNKHTSIPPLY